jgi:hypothetical protein
MNFGQGWRTMLVLFGCSFEPYRLCHYIVLTINSSSDFLRPNLG